MRLFIKSIHKNSMIRTVLICMSLLFGLVTDVQAQTTHFTGCKTYQNSSTMIVVGSTMILRVNGADLPLGSEIAVVLEDGTCAGAVVWNRSLATLDVARDNPTTSQKDGYVSGDKIIYKIWDKNTNIEYLSNEIVATYTDNGDPSRNGTFLPASNYTLQSLSATRNGGGGSNVVFTSTPIATGSEGSPYSYNVTISSTNATAILSLTAPTKPSWLTLSPSGANRWTLSGNPTDANEGSHTIRLTASDGTNSVNQDFTLVISNAAPIADLTAPSSGVVGATLAMSVSATDPGGDALTYTWNFGDNTTPESDATKTAVTHTYTAQGTYTLTLTVADGDGATVVKTQSITIGSNNSPPVFTSSAPTGNILEGATFSYNITTSDGDNDTRTITSVTIPTWLSLVDNGNGTARLSGNPSDPQEGAHSVSIKVRDSKGAETTQNFTLTVVNAPPTVPDISGSGGRIGNILSFSSVATDPGGDILTYEWTWGDNTAKQTGVGLSNVTHTYTAIGTYTVTLLVTDSDGASITKTKFITITAETNTAPAFVSVPVRTANEGSTYSYTISVTDAEGNPLTISAPIKPSWMTLTNTGAGTATLSANSAIQGTHTVVLEVSDGTSSIRQSFEVVVSNLPPIILSLSGNASGLAGSTFSFTSVANDPGNDALTYTWNWGDNTPQQSGATLKDNSHIYTTAGTYTLKLIVTDSDGATAMETRQITVGGTQNAPPVFSSAALTSVNEGSRYFYNITTSDGNNDARTIGITGKPTWLTFTDNRDGTATLSGTPFDTEEGEYPITLTVNDGKGGTGTQTFTLKVNNVAPVISNVTGKFSGGAGENLNFGVTATDAGNESISYSWNWGDGTAIQGGENLTSITHTYTRSGTFTLTIIASDNDGGRTTETRTVVIGAAQNPPIFTSQPGTSIPEGSKYTYNVTYQGGNGGALTLTAPTLPSWLVLTNTGSGTATLSGTPTDANEGVNNIVLQVTDGTQIVKQTFSISVVNTPPTITNITGSSTGAVNTAMSFSGTATDPGNDTLTYTWNFGDGTPQQIGQNVSHTYTLVGSFPLVLTVTDSDGASNVLTRIISITGTQQNITKSDLSVNATLDNPTPRAGTNVNYTITVQNLGPDVATNVQVQNLLPEGLIYLNHTNGMTYNPANGIWYLANLPINTVQTLVINAQVNPIVQNGTVLAQMVNVFKSDQLDQNVVNNSKVVSIQVQGGQTVDVNVNATASVTAVKPNDEISATILVSNTGTGTAQNVNLTIALPNDMVYGSTTLFTSGWTITSQPAVGARGGSIQVSTTSLSPNQIAMFQLRGTIATGTPTSTLTINTTASTSSTDSDPSNNSRNMTFQVTGTTGGNTCGLNIQQTVNNALPKAGEFIDYMIVATNSGILTQTNVRVTHRFPFGLNFVQQIATSGGSYNSATGEWNIGALARNNVATLTLRATLASSITAPLATTAYIASNEGCVAQATVSVTPYQTSSGGNGGVESNGDKAEALNKAAFRQMLGTQHVAPVQSVINRQSSVISHQSSVVNHKQQIANSKQQTANNALSIVHYPLSIVSPFVPTAGPENTTGIVVTPTWITQNGATNAREVFAMDYVTPNQRRLGAVMVMDSGNQLYDHTKFVCDRVSGARISEVQTVQVNGKPFISGLVTHPDGNREYAISFVAYETSNQFIVDSRFSRQEYVVPSGVIRTLNFQVWATTLSHASTLTQNILELLARQRTVNIQQTTVQVPKVFIQNVKYKAGTVTMEIANYANASTATISGRYRDVESKTTSQWTNRTWNISLNPSQSLQTIQLPTGGIYDMSFSIASGNSGIDEAYISDGTWGFYDPANKPQSFVITPQTNLTNEFGTYFLERNIAFSGTTPGTSSEDYVSIYRYLASGRTTVNLTRNQFQNVSFIASGQGTFQIEIVKSSITGWDQFTSPLITLSATARTYNIALNTFTRVAGGALNLDDVQMVVFRFLGNTRSPQFISLNLNNVRFAGGNSVANEDENELPTAISLEQNYPNPFNPSTQIEFRLNTSQTIRLEVFDLLGRQVATLAQGAFNAGTHTATFDASTLPSGVYVYRLQAGTQTFTKKMMMVK